MHDERPGLYNCSASMPGLPTISELAPRLRRKEISPVEIARECLLRIEQLNPQFNAFITEMTETALDEARAAEREIARGQWRGPLHGVPIALKDLIDTAGVRTTAASARYKDRIPVQDAEVVRRLRQAGAVIVGKNNLHECAYGGSSMISYFGEVRNPRDTTRIAGGSSGGSAASVVAGMACAAIGTDTAGSVREPAALCGCVGLKPTHGRVSAQGVIPLSPSLDHVGPLAMCVADVAIVLQAIAGYDFNDITSIDLPVADYPGSLREDIQKLCVGVPRDYFCDELDPEVAASFEDAVVEIRRLVSEVRDLRLEVPTDRTLQAAEAYAYHAEGLSRNEHLYCPETARRIRNGENVSATEYIERRTDLQCARRNIGETFSEVDLLLTATTPLPAPSIAELKANPDELRPAELKLLRNTRPFNVWGLPAISIPCGTTQAGLPIGLQIAAPHGREDLVLRAAFAYEQKTGWKLR